MSFIDLFTWFVLLIIVATAVGVFVFMGLWPGKVAHERNHPQADAINVCGWWGVITMGLLLPLAWIWAYTKPRKTD